VSVCRCSVETPGRIELVLAWRLPFTYPALCYRKIQANLLSTYLDRGGLSKRDKLDRRRSSNCPGRRLVYHTDRPYLFTARCRCVGSSAVAGTCWLSITVLCIKGYIVTQVHKGTLKVHSPAQSYVNGPYSRVLNPTYPFYGP